MKKIKLCLCVWFLLPLVISCKKQPVILSTKTNEIFWVTSNGADMPVWVKGNTASNVLILIIHGGPGEGAYGFSDYETARLQEKYAVAFWDQRDAGAASGNNNYKQLSFSQMVSDMESVVKVIRYRYPQTGIFLYAHSFGGLLGAGFLAKDTNQNLVKGWIDIDGAHNYPLTNSLSRQMLIDTGSNEISKGNHVPAWQEIVNYCKSNDPNASFVASTKTETYAHSAESLEPITTSSGNIKIFSPEDPFALLSNAYKMYFTNQGSNFLESLETANYSPQLSKVKIPSLLLWGKYDFTVPVGIGVDAQNNLGSAYKKLVVFPHSGHRPMQGDTDAVENEIIGFVEQFK